MTEPTTTESVIATLKKAIEENNAAQKKHLDELVILTEGMKKLKNSLKAFEPKPNAQSQEKE